jgi:hypothetical protein
MSARSFLPPLLESFFRNRLVKQRNASVSTIASYRDALRMLILFAADQAGRKPCELAVEHLDRDMVLAFLDELEQKRKNTIQTRNARLSAIRSFFRHVAANDPTSLGIAQRVLAIPIKRSHTTSPDRSLMPSSTRRTCKHTVADGTGRCSCSSDEPAPASPKRSELMHAIFGSIARDRTCSCAARAAKSGSCHSQVISSER